MYVYRIMYKIILSIRIVWSVSDQLVTDIFYRNIRLLPEDTSFPSGQYATLPPGSKVFFVAVVVFHSLRGQFSPGKSHSDRIVHWKNIWTEWTDFCQRCFYVAYRFVTELIDKTKNIFSASRSSSNIKNHFKLFPSWRPLHVLKLIKKDWSYRTVTKRDYFHNKYTITRVKILL